MHLVIFPKALRSLGAGVGVICALNGEESLCSGHEIFRFSDKGQQVRDMCFAENFIIQNFD